MGFCWGNCDGHGPPDNRLPPSPLSRGNKLKQGLAELGLESSATCNNTLAAPTHPRPCATQPPSGDGYPSWPLPALHLPLGQLNQATKQYPGKESFWGSKAEEEPSTRRDRSACPPADRVRGLGYRQGEVCGRCPAEPGLPFATDLHMCSPLPPGCLQRGAWSQGKGPKS